MISIITRILRALSFESVELKHEYHLYNREGEKKLLAFIQVIVTVYFAAFTIVDIFIGAQLKYILIKIAFIIASCIIFIFRTRWMTLYKVTTTLLAVSYSFYMTAITLGLFADDRDSSQIDHKAVFISANGLGMMQIMFILSFKALWFRLIPFLLFGVVQFACFSSSSDPKVLLYSQFMLIMLQILGFCLYYDLTEKKIFSTIYQSREKLRKFQDLLSNDLPSSVMIMAADLSSLLYSNKFFQERFTSHEDINENRSSVIDNLFQKFTIDREAGDGSTEERLEEVSLIDYLKAQAEKSVDNTAESESMHVFTREEDGRKLHYEIRLRKIVWDAKSSYAIVMNDTSDKQMVSALKTADEHKDRVIATVSHELRTPINGILGLLEMATELATDSTLISYLDYCKSCSKLLLYLVNAILDLSQLRHNSLKVVKNTFNITELLEEVRSLYIFQANQKGVSFIIETDQEVPEQLYTDKYRLIEILINLLGNAMKFTQKGFVKLAVSPDPQSFDKLMFSVEDTGLGIKEEHKSQLFKMFGKIQHADKNINSHGVGLGLTIANELVKVLSDGLEEDKILFDSEFGKGTRFWFSINISEPDSYIEQISGECLPVYSMDVKPRELMEYDYISHSPLRKIEQLADRDSILDRTNPFFGTPRETHELLLLTQRTSSATQDNKEILLVDDNPLNLLAAGFIINKLGYNVTKAYDGNECLRTLEVSMLTGKHYALILTDIQMPIMDGLEMSRIITEKIRKNEIYSVPIVALTAKKIDRKEREVYERHGIVEALEKPLVKEQVEEILSKLVG